MSERSTGQTSQAARQRPRAQARAGQLAVPADRRLRLHLRLPHRRAGRARRHDRVAVRAALRRPERLRHAAGPRRRRLPPRPVRDERARRAPLRAGHQHRRDDVDDAVGLADRARRARDRPVGAAQQAPTARAPARRPTTPPSTCSCAPSSASRAASRSRWSASRCSTTRASRPSGPTSTAPTPPSTPTTTPARCG